MSMQRYHDTNRDPLPIRSPGLDAERQRLEQATLAFLAEGGQIEQIGYQMKDKYSFVIDASKSPVYAPLFQPSSITAQAKQALEAEPVELLSGEQLAARLIVQAALGASPKQAAQAVGIGEKQARQLARDFHIQFKRQR
ncbi:hypothetical protein FBY03_111129 [Pseudomonas sp. SJZ079]|uniref:hypothetical protein n=1 Tax=Pseudomonas sp. SJZ079 TaxID=2572887 RepID=UPI00119B60E0|nr:hypothetical protein [Pseudomonas sp. SJZ079]TWC35081.1 hypothetical protein FBY03_111129 [Pseudomonas sp. SJZ079]